MPIDLSKKICTRCLVPGGRKARLSETNFRALPRGDYVAMCRVCEAEVQTIKRAQPASEYEFLKQSDFKTGVANDGHKEASKEASKERRQEFSPKMGAYGHALSTGATVDTLSPELGTYIGLLSEQERRFGNRRLVRSVSLSAAQEAINIQHFQQMARDYFRGIVKPSGYALKRGDKHLSRTDIIHLSDLHFGSELSSVDEPVQYGAIEEARRFEYVVRCTLDYKPQYRDQSSLLVLLNGDLISGFLQKDLRDGAPLTEQKAACWKYLSVAIALFSQRFPKVHVVCQPGNHGRDIVRHPGRATSSKWDGHEFQIYFALREMCSELHNVTWDLPFRAISIVDLYGSKMLVTHGDTELKFGDPDTASMSNSRTLDGANSANTYGVQFHVAAMGHYHKCRVHPRNVTEMWNGALIPPTGWMRTQGFVGEKCGQLLWEAVEGHPVGDIRFLEVGPAQDRDEKLGTIIKPFRFDPGHILR